MSDINTLLEDSQERRIHYIELNEALLSFFRQTKFREHDTILQLRGRVLPNTRIHYYHKILRDLSLANISNRRTKQYQADDIKFLVIQMEYFLRANKKYKILFSRFILELGRNLGLILPTPPRTTKGFDSYWSWVLAQAAQITKNMPIQDNVSVLDSLHKSLEGLAYDEIAFRHLL